MTFVIYIVLATLSWNIKAQGSTEYKRHRRVKKRIQQEGEEATLRSVKYCTVKIRRNVKQDMQEGVKINKQDRPAEQEILTDIPMTMNMYQ